MLDGSISNSQSFRRIDNVANTQLLVMENRIVSERCNWPAECITPNFAANSKAGNRKKLREFDGESETNCFRTTKKLRHQDDLH